LFKGELEALLEGFSGAQFFQVIFITDKCDGLGSQFFGKWLFITAKNHHQLTLVVIYEPKHSKFVHSL